MTKFGADASGVFVFQDGKKYEKFFDNSPMTFGLENDVAEILEDLEEYSELKKILLKKALKDLIDELK